MAVPNQMPEKGLLAKRLESLECVRDRMLVGNGHVTTWPDEQTMGVKSVRAMALNAEILEVVALYWCPQWDHVKPLTIGLARQEVGAGIHK